MNYSLAINFILTIELMHSIFASLQPGMKFARSSNLARSFPPNSQTQLFVYDFIIMTD